MLFCFDFPFYRSPWPAAPKLLVCRMCPWFGYWNEAEAKFMTSSGGVDLASCKARFAEGSSWTGLWFLLADLMIPGLQLSCVAKIIWFWSLKIWKFCYGWFLWVTKVLVWLFLPCANYECSPDLLELSFLGWLPAVSPDDLFDFEFEVVTLIIWTGPLM